MLSWGRRTPAPLVPCAPLSPTLGFLPALSETPSSRLASLRHRLANLTQRFFTHMSPLGTERIQVMGRRLRFGPAHRLLAALASLSLLTALATPGLAWACPAEYEGTEAGRSIAAGSSTRVGATFEFSNANEREQVSCEERYTWAMQTESTQFVVTPSYTNNANCLYRGARAEVIVGGTCRYRFGQPVPFGTAFSTRQTIAGAGCEVRLRTEGVLCEVRISNEALNENLEKVTLSNAGANLRITPAVHPINYTRAGCVNPIAAPGTVLKYSSLQEVPNARIN